MTVPAVDDAVIHDLRWRRYALPAAALARELGLFEDLRDRTQSIDEVAASLGVDPRAAEVLLVVNAANGLLDVHDDGYRTSAIARTYLCSDSPYQGGRLLPPDDALLVRLRDAVLRPGARRVGVAVDIASHPLEGQRSFVSQMHAMSLPASGAFARSSLLRGVERLLDVGAGSGSLSIAFALEHPQSHCLMFDIEPVTAIAATYVTEAGVANRVHHRSGDMFSDEWPSGFDGVLFGNVFHDWPPDQCRELAGRAFLALEPGGHVFLHEMLLTDRKDGPLTIACLSAAMLVHEHGKQYSFRELAELLTTCGFTDVVVEPTFGYYSVVRARRPHCSSPIR